jgi:hypothetical protein
VDGPGFDADPYSPAGGVSQTGAHARGLGRCRWGRVAAWLVVIAIVSAPAVSLLVIWMSHDSNPDEPEWQRAVDRALVGATPDGLCVAPSSGNSRLPGFGAVDAQCVLSTGYDNVQVRFVHGTGPTNSFCSFLVNPMSNTNPICASPTSRGSGGEEKCLLPTAPPDPGSCQVADRSGHGPLPPSCCCPASRGTLQPDAAFPPEPVTPGSEPDADPVRHREKGSGASRRWIIVARDSRPQGSRPSSSDTRERLVSIVVALLGGAIGLTACAGSTSTPTDATGTVIVVRPPTCPGQNSNQVQRATPLQPLRSGVSSDLVPPGPDFATICRYGPIDARGAGTLRRSSVVANPGLRALVAFLSSSKWQVITQPQTYMCPSDDGQADIVHLVYPSGPDVRVVVGLRGCRFASNGGRTVAGYAIGRRLAALVGG